MAKLAVPAPLHRLDRVGVAAGVGAVAEGPVDGADLDAEERRGDALAGDEVDLDRPAARRSRTGPSAPRGRRCARRRSRPCGCPTRPTPRPRPRHRRDGLAHQRPPVGGQDVAGAALGHQLAVLEQDGAVADPLHGLGVVRDEHHRAPAAPVLEDPPQALALEGLVADGEHLVQQQHVGVDVRGHGEAEAGVHARRVGPHRVVDEGLQLREGDDRLHPLVDLAAREPLDGGVHVDVLAAR